MIKTVTNLAGLSRLCKTDDTDDQAKIPIQIFSIENDYSNVLKIYHATYTGNETIFDDTTSAADLCKSQFKETTYIQFESATEHIIIYDNDNVHEFSYNNLQEMITNFDVEKFYNYTFFVKNVDPEIFISRIIDCYIVNKALTVCESVHLTSYKQHIFINKNKNLIDIIHNMYVTDNTAKKSTVKFAEPLLPPDKFAFGDGISSEPPAGIHKTRYQMGMAVVNGKLVSKYSNYPDVYDAYMRGLPV